MATADQQWLQSDTDSGWGTVTKNNDASPTYQRLLATDDEVGMSAARNDAGAGSIDRGFLQIDNAKLVTDGYTAGTAITSGTVAIELASASSGTVRLVGNASAALGDSDATLFGRLGPANDAWSDDILVDSSTPSVKTFTLNATARTAIAALGPTDKFVMGFCLVSEAANGGAAASSYPGTELTLTLNFEAGAAAPTVQATNVVASNVQATQATFSCTPGNGAKRLCMVAVGASEDFAGSAVDGTTYPANSVFGSSTPIDDDGVLWYPVYNGTGSSVTVTGLPAGTALSVHWIEYNGDPAAEFYLADTATGNPLNAGLATLVVTAKSITRGDDFNPNLTPVVGTARWALETETGARTVTVHASVVTSGIDLDEAFGPIIIENGDCDFAGGGVTFREWGITIAANDVTLDDFTVEPNETGNGRGVVVTDGAIAVARQNVSVSNVNIVANGDDAIGIQQQQAASTFDNISFENIVVDSVSAGAQTLGLLVSGIGAGAINGKFTYEGMVFGGNEPLAHRIPRMVGGLHTFTDCGFVQGQSTSDIHACHVNWIRQNFFTRANPGGLPDWYLGRLIMVRYPETTRMYFEGCTLNGAPATYQDLCKMFSLNGNADIPASCISLTPLTTVPQNPIPVVDSITPNTADPEAPDTEITITGEGFRPNSVVRVAGEDVETTLVDTVLGTELTAIVPASAMVEPGRRTITVFNPAPSGGQSTGIFLKVGTIGGDRYSLGVGEDEDE